MSTLNDLIQSKHDFMQRLTRAKMVIAEFVSDVNAAGIEQIEEDWPDLAVTFQAACAFLNSETPEPDEDEETT